MRCKLITLIIFFSVGGCGPIIWDKPGATQAQFNQDNARCRLIARGMNPGGFYAQGSAEFVAGAAVGNAIGTAINQRETYKDCMTAGGYTARSTEAQADIANLKPVTAQYTACASAVYSSPEAAPIRARSPFNVRDATPAQLSDPAVATDQEIAAIGSMWPKLQSCQKYVLEQLARLMPTTAPIYSAAYAKGDGDIALLQARGLSWGNFNSRRRDRMIAVETQLTAALQNHGS